MKRKWGKAQKLEALSLGVYAVWLLFSLFTWRTEWMKPNRVNMGLALAFGALVVVLINCIRTLPQLRMTRPGLPPELAAQVIRLRVAWLAEFKLILILGFAVSSLALLVGGLLRTAVSVVLLAALLFSLVRFILRGKRLQRAASVRARR